MIAAGRGRGWWGMQGCGMEGCRGAGQLGCQCESFRASYFT